MEELVEDGVLSLDADGNWTREAVDEAADFYERCELFVPYATMCQAPFIDLSTSLSCGRCLGQHRSNPLK
ncbi:MAG: hypothetical protein MK165_15135 [Pirellulaceae bacterium]|nr:hypothetical protein [Pirellulaceae bacterium]